MQAIRRHEEELQQDKDHFEAVAAKAGYVVPEEREKLLQDVRRVNHLELVAEVHPVLASIISINVHLCTFCGDDTRQVKLEDEAVGANFVTPDGHTVCRNCLPDAHIKYDRVMQRYI